MSLHKKKFNFEDPEDSYWNESGSISSSVSLFDDLPSKQWAARAAVDNLFDARDEGANLPKPAALPSAPTISQKAGGDAHRKNISSDLGQIQEAKLEPTTKTKIAVEIDSITPSNRAPSIISENSVSSLPSEAQRLDLDFNRLRAEHRKLQKHLETIRYERFKPLDVGETVKRLQKGEPVTLDLYRTKVEKLQLLQAAMNTFDSDIIQRIMIFLRQTLGDTAFREVLMFHPEAADEFIDYLKMVQDFERLNTVYLWLGRHDDAHMVEIAVAMRIRNPEQKLTALRRIAQNEQLDPDVIFPIRSYVALLERQISIQNTDVQERSIVPVDARRNAPLPFNPTLGTLYYIGLYHYRCFEGDIRNPLAFKTAMNLTEKEFLWVMISAHAHKERWEEIERLLEIKTGLFSPKTTNALNYEFLFKLFYRAPQTPPITFLEKICRSISESDIRQKISIRYKIPLINQPGFGQIIPGRQSKIPFLGKRC